MALYRIALALGLLGLAISPAPAVAEDLTEEEIVDRFMQQKTRGLSIAPVAQGDGAAGGSQAQTSVAAEAGMRILPQDQQVNVNIAFDFDSAALRADQKPRLMAMCGAMKAVEGETFQILGHTDASGSEAYNQRLSQLRAEEVKRFLVNDCGIAPDRLEAKGVGERFPFDADDPRADVNRRVEFQVSS
jgi:outer membrane protein OmpA-like peptidoglycan-associated protein